MRKRTAPDEKRLPRYAVMIRELRHRCSLTQAEFAGKLSVKANTIARWELAGREPYVWNYWSLYSLSQLRGEWDLAEFFNARVETTEQHTKWDRRHLLRHLGIVRARANTGDPFALRLLKASEEERSDYLRKKLQEIDAARYSNDVPPELDKGCPKDPGEFAQYEAKLGRALESWQLEIANVAIKAMREIELVDLLREGQELEKLEIQETELKRQGRIHRDKAENVRKRFELFRSQRKEAREILQARQAADTEGTEYEFARAEESLAQALGLDEAPKGGREPKKPNEKK